MKYDKQWMRKQLRAATTNGHKIVAICGALAGLMMLNFTPGNGGCNTPKGHAALELSPGAASMRSLAQCIDSTTQYNVGCKLPAAPVYDSIYAITSIDWLPSYSYQKLPSEGDKDNSKCLGPQQNQWSITYPYGEGTNAACPTDKLQPAVDVEDFKYPCGLLTPSSGNGGADVNSVYSCGYKINGTVTFSSDTTVATSSTLSLTAGDPVQTFASWSFTSITANTPLNLTYGPSLPVGVYQIVPPSSSLCCIDATSELPEISVNPLDPIDNNTVTINITCTNKVTGDACS